MKEPCCIHPEEDMLEQYLLKRLREDKIETIECHILGCESCVSRLESLDLQLTAMKSVLAQLREKEGPSTAGKTRAGLRQWFTRPAIAWVGSLAAIAIATAVVPQFTSSHPPVANVTLVAYRGQASVLVPRDHPLHVTLNTDDLPAGAADVSLLDSNGVQIWSGATQIHDDQISVTIPCISRPGVYFIRIYSEPASIEKLELLREFLIKVR